MKAGLTQTEAAAALGVSRQAIAKRMRKGTLPVLADGTIDGEALAAEPTAHPDEPEASAPAVAGVSLREFVWGFFFTSFSIGRRASGLACAQLAAQEVERLDAVPLEEAGAARPFLAAMRTQRGA